MQTAHDLLNILKSTWLSERLTDNLKDGNGVLEYHLSLPHPNLPRSCRQSRSISK